MSYLLMNSQFPDSFRKNSNWFLMWGIALIFLGTLAISAAAVTTLISIVFLGALILASGVIIVVDTYKFWWGKWKGFFLHLAMAALYIVAGGMLIVSPEYGSLSLTLLLGIFYTLVGVFRLTYSLTLKLPRWGWSLVSAIISLLLGVLILSNWPASSMFIIGLFVGIDLLFCGWAYVMIGLSAKKFA